MKLFFTDDQVKLLLWGLGEMQKFSLLPWAHDPALAELVASIEAQVREQPSKRKHLTGE